MFKTTIISLFVFLGTVGCSPALNWRQVNIGAINVLLPCKPDHAKRSLVLSDIPVEMSMAGCEADEALFAISHVQADSPLQANKIMEYWKQITLSKLKSQEQVSLQRPNASPNNRIKKDDQSYYLLKGVVTSGDTTQAKLQWIVDGSHVYHKAVFAKNMKPEYTDPLFENH